MLSDAIKARYLKQCVDARTLSLTHPNPTAASFYLQMAADLEAVMDHVLALEDELVKLRQQLDVESLTHARE